MSPGQPYQPSTVSVCHRLSHTSPPHTLTLYLRVPKGTSGTEQQLCVCLSSNYKAIWTERITSNILSCQNFLKTLKLNLNTDSKSGLNPCFEWVSGDHLAGSSTSFSRVWGKLHLTGKTTYLFVGNSGESVLFILKMSSENIHQCTLVFVWYYFHSISIINSFWIFCILFSDWRVAWRSCQVPLKQVPGLLLWNPWDVSEIRLSSVVLLLCTTLISMMCS